MKEKIDFKHEGEEIEIELGDDEGVFWNDRLKECEKAIDILESELKMNLAIKEMIDSKLHQ